MPNFVPSWKRNYSVFPELAVLAEILPVFFYILHALEDVLFLFVINVTRDMMVARCGRRSIQDGGSSVQVHENLVFFLKE